MSRVLPILFNTDMVRAILDGRKTVTRRVIKPQQVIGLGCDKCPNNMPEEYIKQKKMLFKPWCDMSDNELIGAIYRPPYQPGDILYVRETWRCWRAHRYEATADIMFKAGGDGVRLQFANGNTDSVDRYDYDKFVDKWFSYEGKWTPSLHMPKGAARIFLKVKDVRVERLQDITEEQAKAEGICRLYDDMSKSEYEAWARKIGRLESQEESSFKNYLWHGNFGSCGCGNKLSDAWKYQYSGYDNAVGSFSSLWNTTVDLKDWDKYGWDVNPYVWVIEFEQCEKPEEW